MITLELSTLIQRPVDQVYTYISNFANITQWQSNLREVRQKSPGPVAVGTIYHTTGEIIGRKIDGEITITEMQPNQIFSYKGSNGPMSIQARITFKALGGGTKITLAAQIEPGGVAKIAEGLLANQVKAQMEKNVANLKARLETIA